MSIVRGLLVIGGVLAVCWVALVVLAWGFQRQLIYLPDRTEPAPPTGVEIEQVVLHTRDGLELGAWFVPAVDQAVSAIVVANGNAGNRSHRLPLAQALSARGHDVLLFDYRGYGGNPGRPHADGLVADAHAAATHLAERPDVDADQVVYLGESLGSGVVAALAVEREPAALILRSGFPSLAEVGRRHYPFLPVRTLLRERYPTAAHLEHVAEPVLVIAGASDRIVPAALSRELAEGSGAAYVEIPDADHNDPALLDGEAFIDAIDAFVRRHR